MKKEIYVSPEFNFQKMKLVERVAEECWGTGSVWFDVNNNKEIDHPLRDLNNDGNIDPGDSELVGIGTITGKENGCQGSELGNIVKWFQTYFPDECKDLTPDEVKTNTKSNGRFHVNPS